MNPVEIDEEGNVWKDSRFMFVFDDLATPEVMDRFSEYWKKQRHNNDVIVREHLIKSIYKIPEFEKVYP